MSLQPGQVDVGFQIAVLIAILLGYSLKLMKKLLYHGVTMAVAAFMNLASFVVVMLPTSGDLILFVAVNPYSRLSLAFVVHMALGIVTGILALWILVAWRFRRSVKDCIKRKMIMRVTIVFWLATWAMGFVTYLYLFSIV